MSPDRLENEGSVTGRSWWCSHACVVGAGLGNVAEHVTWRDSRSCLSLVLAVSCLWAAACSASLSSETFKYPEPACARLCQGSIPDSSGWGWQRCPCKSRELQSIPSALPAVTSHFLFPSPCPTVARTRWRFLPEGFPSWTFPFCSLNMYPSSLLPGGASLSFLVHLCNAWGWPHK